MNERTEEMSTVINEAVQPAMDLVEATAKKSGKGAVVIVAAAAGVMAVGALIVGGVKLGANLIKEHNAKKEMRKPDDGTVVEVTHEQAVELSK